MGRSGIRNGIGHNQRIGGSLRSNASKALPRIANPRIRNFSKITTLSQTHQLPNVYTAIPKQHLQRKFSSSSADGVVTQKLNELIADGGVQPDSHQRIAAQQLDRLYNELIAIDPQPATSQAPSTQSGGFLSGIFGGFSSIQESVMETLAPSPKGIYTYGGVGCGKTFLMELFYKALDEEPNWVDNKQMVHYHKFMLNVHQFMHNSKQEQREKGVEGLNPIDAVVDHVLESGRLLCLDEFQVTDVADAMILKELFGKLWRRRCILVTTSNRPPRDLYLHGLQRDRFLPFVDLLEEKCSVVSLMENETDYRMVISARDKEEQKTNETSADDGGDAPSTSTTSSARRAKQVYFCGRGQKKALQKIFYERARGLPTNPSTLETQGRKVKIPMACKSKSICMFSFEDLCQKALGAADYLVIGQHFSTVFVHGVPKMTVNEINWLRRFITFVDSMYEWKVRVLLQTNVESIERIFVVEDDKESYQQDEVFAFDRTYSRLGEMSSTQYLSSQWLGGDTTLSTTKLDLDPSLADQWFQMVGSGLENSSKNSDKNEEERYEELFAEFDINSDGVLDKNEVKAMMTDAFGYEPVDLVVNEMIASVDTDHNGVIDFDEFKTLLAEIRNHTKA